VSRADLFLTFHAAHAELTFNRPAKRNALNLDMWEGIPRILREAMANPQVRALVLNGAGGVFSAGADIAEFETTYGTAEAALANHRLMQAAMAALEDFPLPTIAMIEGPCVGGGCGLALCCDLRFAAPSARFGITPAKLGLVYGVGDTRRLVQAVGLSAAKDILFSGRLMDAIEAKALGLVDRVIPQDALESETLDYVETLAGASSFSARSTKAIMGRLREGAVIDDEASRALFASAFAGEDFKEGFAAFQEKRPPDFRKAKP
jgi:enoyl-CoA hydratase/carnithine racemase